MRSRKKSGSKKTEEEMMEQKRPKLRMYENDLRYCVTLHAD